MQYLAENANVISLTDLLVTDFVPAPLNCAITWDDGYGSIHEYALPVLRKHNFPATVYVTTGLIGERQALTTGQDQGIFPGLRMLTWEQIEELRENGFDIGGHLVSHLDLTALNREQAVSELTSSKAAIELHTQTPCLDFAYPWGLANRTCAEWVRQSGYRSAVTTLHAPLHAHSDHMLLPRLTIAPSYDLPEFRAILRGDWDYLAILGRAKAQFRTVRALAHA